MTGVEGGRARGGWAARIEQFGGVVRPVLYLRLKFGLRQYLRGGNVDFFLNKKTMYSAMPTYKVKASILLITLED